MSKFFPSSPNVRGGALFAGILLGSVVAASSIGTALAQSGGSSSKVSGLPADMQADYAEWKRKFQEAGGKLEAAPASAAASSATGSTNAGVFSQLETAPRQITSAASNVPAPITGESTTAASAPLPASVSKLPSDLQSQYRQFQQEFEKKSRGPVSALNTTGQATTGEAESYVPPVPAAVTGESTVATTVAPVDRIRSAAERAEDLDVAVPGAPVASSNSIPAPAPEPFVPAAAAAVEQKEAPRAVYSAADDAAAADQALSAYRQVESAPASATSPATVASIPAEPEKKRGFFKRLFGIGKDKTPEVVAALPVTDEFDPAPEPLPAGAAEAAAEGHPVAAEEVSAAGTTMAAAVPATGGRTLVELESQSDGMQRFPLTDMPHTKSARTETQIDRIIEAVTSLYTERADGVNELEMGLDFASLPSVPKGFDAPWSGAIRQQIWGGQRRVSRDLFGVYASALENSHQVRAFSEIPLIRETGIQEARGQFDIISFIDGRTSHLDEPTSSELTTGQIGRFLEDRTEGEVGVRKQFALGTEVSLSNRISTLDNNSQFTSPNPQTASEVVISVTQPLLAGGGYHYNSTRLKVAKLDSKMAAAEYLRQLETYLLEVNRAYWGVYLARAGYLQKRSLVDRTEGIVGQLQEREGVDESANLSELLRARSSLAQRRASLIRSAMSIRTAEERLRALVNDPEFSLGSSSEFVPSTLPILGGPKENIRDVALDAITNRSEVLQSVYQVKAAGLLRDQQKRDLLPTLNLILEATSSGLDANRDLGGAYDDQTENDVGWLAGFQFQVPWERNFAKARHTRRNHELRQQQHQLRSTIDNVLLEAIVAYQELRTSYRDMQGKYQAVLATREELEQLEERLDVDTDDERTVGYQLQLILDSIERNEASEEAFLVSVVLYNVSFTSLDRARGTLLRQHGVEIRRYDDGEMDVIEAGLGSRPSGGGGKSGSGKSGAAK